MLTPTKWRQAASRVADMSWDEIRTRLRQEIAKRYDAVIFGLGAGSVSAELRGPDERRRIARGESPASSPGRFFFGQEEISRIVELLAERFPHEAAGIIDQDERICHH